MKPRGASTIVRPRAALTHLLASVRFKSMAAYARQSTTLRDPQHVRGSGRSKTELLSGPKEICDPVSGATAQGRCRQSARERHQWPGEALVVAVIPGWSRIGSRRERTRRPGVPRSYITAIESGEWPAEAVPLKGRPNLFEFDSPRAPGGQRHPRPTKSALSAAASASRRLSS
jgi:hypothetical protein